MKFVSTVTTSDLRLTAGKAYEGGFVLVGKQWNQHLHDGLRIVVWDNRNEWMTFNVHAFKPAQAPTTGADGEA